jgi:hypothetical protein
VQRETRTRETRNGARRQSKFDFDLWDLGSVAAGLAADTKIPAAVRDAAAQTAATLKPQSGPVLAERHLGQWFDGIGGASVYLPQGKTQLSEWYVKLAFAKDTRWDQLLAAYREHLL